jgi:23S rRNA (adenine2503-C2)-methyltransferase
MLPEDLEAHLQAEGMSPRPDQVRRVLAEVISRGQEQIAPRRAVSAALLTVIEASTRRDRLEVVERVTDEADGFVKYLFRSPDGALSEGVRIPLKKPGCFTVCLSSQVGCAMGCVFCATGRLGFSRNLHAWEMVSALLTVRDEAPGRVTGVVFQGQGEPFHNYDHVIAAAKVLSHPCGGRIRSDAITISTVGLVPQIRRYTREGHRFRLIVSLTSALPDLRAALLPVAGRFPLEELAEAIREHAAVAKGRMTVAWVLMGGVNHSAQEVEALKNLFSDVPLRLNLIDINDARADGFRRADPGELREFIDRLQVLGVPIVRRYSGGAGRDAACGMLAARRHEDADPHQIRSRTP